MMFSITSQLQHCLNFLRFMYTNLINSLEQYKQWSELASKTIKKMDAGWSNERVNFETIDKIIVKTGLGRLITGSQNI